MLTLIDRALEPSSSMKDKITYMTSVQALQSIRADNNQLEIVAEKIKNSLASTSSRYVGLVLLETALQQNSEIAKKANWTYIIVEIIKSPDAAIFKEKACRISSMIVDSMIHDSSFSLDNVKEVISKIVPVILEKARDSEWIRSAAKCLSACMRSYPSLFLGFKNELQEFIMHHMNGVCSLNTEALAECFAELPNCNVKGNKTVACEEWTQQFNRTLNTMHNILNSFLTFVSDDSCKTSEIPQAGLYNIEMVDDAFAFHMSGARYFINFSKCLSKMLSSNSPSTVRIPIKQTLECISRLFQIQDVAKISVSTIENQLILSVFSQLQIAALCLLEPIIINVYLVPYSFFITHLLFNAVQSSSLNNISKFCISPLRHVVWKLINIWIGAMGSQVCFDTIQHFTLIEELLKDISVEDMKSQPDGRSRTKTISTVPESEFSSRKDDMKMMCCEALKALRRLIHTGATFLDGKTVENIFTHLLVISNVIHPSREPPFPYDDEKCRKHLYKALLSIAISGNSHQIQPVMCCSAIFNLALRDSSVQVRSVCYEGLATCRLFLHPKKPQPALLRSSRGEKRPDAVINRSTYFAGWQDDYPYVPNAPAVEKVPNASDEVDNSASQSYSNVNDDEMLSNDYYQIDSHYSEQISENQCNGESMIEIQSSSMCQEIEESDDDEEDEDEEEEDGRIYSEEEMNQERVEILEQPYIPNADTEIQSLNPACTSQETIEQNFTEHEYDEQAEKSVPVKNVENSNNKNVHFNGVQNSVPEEQIPSSSTHNTANENGIASDEEEMEEEDMDDEDEDGEMSSSAEKRSIDLPLPAKKPKLIEDTNKCDLEEDQGSKSPSLKEMMGDFVLSEVDQVES